jgi:selenocysteine lyase/cysteine desulfurase
MFPALEHVVHLGGCSLAPRSAAVQTALQDMLDLHDHGLAWEEFEAESDMARARFAALIGARADQIALLPNASTAAYQVASGMMWWPRPKLLSTAAEFPGVAHVWLAQQPRGAEVIPVGDADQPPAAEDYLGALDGAVGLVSVPAVTFCDGVRLPVAQIAAAARQVGARVFVDAYQAVGVEPVDVRAWDCDWLVAGASKHLLGLPGLAFLYAKDAADVPREPRLTGWLAQRQPLALRLAPRPDARRLETGTPAVPALFAANAGMGLINDLDLAVVRQHVSGLLDYAADQLAAMGETVRTPTDPLRRGAHLAVVDPEPRALATWLARDGIVVAARQDVVRLSVHYYTDRSDVDAVCEAIRRYRAVDRHPDRTALPVSTRSEV